MVALALILPLLAGPVGDAEAEAHANAVEAHRAFTASQGVLHGWLALQDRETKLIGQNVDTALWSVNNSAADLYPFLVITSYLTEPACYEGPMREILDEEVKRTTRLRSLSDDLSLETDTFAQPFDINRIVFGNAEYAKDGLLPLLEYLGETPWAARLRDIARDLMRESPIASDFGPLPATGAEVNGETLEVLCRLFTATADPAYLEGALRIADAYYLEVLPRNGGLPCHAWDFTAHQPIAPQLYLNDHGNEIIGGLTEAYVLARTYRPEKAAQYEPGLRQMLDSLLTKYRNHRGILSNDPAGEGGVPDTWGYMYNAYYTAYLVLGEERYRQAVLEAFDAITQYLNWGGADAYADCEESALVLLNREPSEPLDRWLKAMLNRHYAFQQESGILEGWYGDGNSARTWLMYALYRTRGTFVTPWRKDIRLGASESGGELTLVGWADGGWQGKLVFDHARSRDHVGLPLNYPRLNEWPEWWTAEPNSFYEVRTEKDSRTVSGRQLIEGLPLSLGKGKPWMARVRRVSRVPHGEGLVELVGPRLVNLANGAVSSVVARNRTDHPLTVHLRVDQGKLSPERLELPPLGEGSSQWTLRGQDLTQATVSAEAEGGLGPVRLLVPVYHQPGLLDGFRLSGEFYKERAYQWLGRTPVVRQVETGGRRTVVLALLWGAKGDNRSAIVRLGGVEQRLTLGGWDGFEWVKLPFELPESTEPVPLEILAPEEGQPAFISEVQVMEGP